MEQRCIYGGMLLYLLAAAAADIRTRKVSLRLAAFFAAASIIMQVMWQDLGIGIWLAGMLPGLFLMVLGWVTRGAVSYGDGVALLVCGSFLGFWGCLEVFLLGLFLSCPVSLFFIAGRKADRKTELPFVPFLLAGYSVWMLASL